MKPYFLHATILAATLCFVGCDPGSENITSTERDARIEVEVDGPDSLVEERMERREARRENLREVIDKVDVDVDAGGVDVKVD